MSDQLKYSDLVQLVEAIEATADQPPQPTVVSPAFYRELQIQYGMHDLEHELNVVMSLEADIRR